jgi:hypothetical protein
MRTATATALVTVRKTAGCTGNRKIRALTASAAGLKSSPPMTVA